MVRALIMAAGGPRGTANQRKVKIRRSGDVIWSGQALQTRS